MWRWPTKWPYAEDFFSTKNNESALAYYAANPDLNGPYIVGDNLESLHGHFERRLPRDGAILDLASGANSYIPPGFPVKELVGVGASVSSMAENKALTKVFLGFFFWTFIL